MICFKFLKLFPPKKPNSLNNIRVECYAIYNDDRLPSNVQQDDNNSSDSSDYNSDEKNSNGTLSVQSSINDNSSNDGNLFPLSITGNDYHTQGITTGIIVNFEKYTNKFLQKKVHVK